MAKKERKPSRASTEEMEENDAERKGMMVKIPGTRVEMWQNVGEFKDVPKVRPYVFNETEVRQIALGVRLDLNICLTGPTGCGKTTLPTALAAYLNQPMIRFNCHGETRVSNMVGLDRPVAKDGVLTLQFSERALVRAMREGYWVLFDEIDAALPAVLFVLQSVLEEGNRRLFIPELDEEIHAHSRFRIFATGNTIGYRNSARAAHAGTSPLNDAFVDRFGMMIACDYPTKAEEVERIKVNVPHCDGMVVEAIARVASELRADQKFRSDFSTRRCVQWARLAAEMGGPPGLFEAAECAVVRKMKNPTDAQVFRELLQRICGGNPNARG